MYVVYIVATVLVIGVLPIVFFSSVINAALSAVGGRPRRMRIWVLCVALVVVLAVGHWRVIMNFPEGIRSRDWPSTQATIIRLNRQYIVQRTEWPVARLDMPYTYTVDGKHYRGERYSVAGPFVGTNIEIN